MSAITLDESRRLVALEKVIKNGLETFIEVGEALCEIRDSKLYRIEHKTFEDYCRTKWGYSRRNAYDLISTAIITKSVQSIAQIGRGDARELGKLSAEEREEVLEEAVEESEPVRAVVARKIAKPSRATAPPTASNPETDARSEEIADALQGAVSDNDRLTRENTALAATDSGKQIAKLIEENGQLRGRIDQLVTESNEAKKQAKYYQKICDGLRKLLGLEKASEIHSAVEKLKG